MISNDEIKLQGVFMQNELFFPNKQLDLTRNEDLNLAMIRKENKEKEEYLQEKLQGIEKILKEIEIEHFKKMDESNIEVDKFVLKKAYRELSKIDNLFIRLDYLDIKSMNLMMDEIDDQLDELDSVLQHNNN